MQAAIIGRNAGGIVIGRRLAHPPGGTLVCRVGPIGASYLGPSGYTKFFAYAYKQAVKRCINATNPQGSLPGENCFKK